MRKISDQLFGLCQNFGGASIMTIRGFTYYLKKSKQPPFTCSPTDQLTVIMADR